MAEPRKAAFYSHTGRRQSNQDAVAVKEISGNRLLVAVADGMGGHSAGEVASARALELLTASLERGADLRTAFQAANAAVFAEAEAHPQWRGMGTTLVALLRVGNTYQVANVGDSRAYRVDGTQIMQLTADHSFTAEAIRAGAMSPEDAASSPWKNALTRAIGTDPVVEIDVFGPFSTDSPHAVLLCSDGLYKSVSGEMIREYLLTTEDLDTAVGTLAALAFRRGSDDNITVAAAEFGSLARRPPDVTIPVPIARQAGAPGRMGHRA